MLNTRRATRRARHAPRKGPRSCDPHHLNTADHAMPVFRATGVA